MASRAHVLRGVIAVGIASVVMRAGGLIGQVVAGYVLSAGDFGLFAATLGFGSISAALLSTLRPLFIERLTNNQSADALWRVILAFLTAAAVLLIGFAEPIAGLINRPDATGVLRLMAPTLPLQFFQVIGIAKLSATFRFQDSSRILTVASLARHGSLILFALSGFGVASLVLPIYVESIVQVYLLRRSAGPFPRLVGEVRGVVGRYGQTLGWLLLCAVGLALTLSGDYLFITPLETAAIVGFYFFGYQLSSALTQPFTMAATSVLVPSFASIRSDLDRTRSSFLEAIGLLLVVSGLAFGFVAVTASFAINAVWGGASSDSVAVVAIMAIGTPFRILQPTCSLLQASAQWRRLGLVMTVGATAVIPAVIGASVGGLRDFAVGATLGAMAADRLRRYRWPNH
ncbi:MAG: oligosaccharide flippase family protein [Acidimicrobiales bacterium]